MPQKLSTQKLGARKCRSGRLERGTSSLQWKHPPDWALQERDSASADTSYVINYLKVASGTFLTPVMQLISPKETQLEASGVSEGAKQKSTFRAWAVLASVLAAPRHGENLCFFQMVRGSRDTFLVSAFVKFSCIFTGNDSNGGQGSDLLEKKNNNDDKSCRCLFSEKSRHLCSASYARPVWLPVFPQSQFPGLWVLACAQFQNTLMRRILSWGCHYCEHLWTVEFNWATANVYCVWKE